MAGQSATWTRPRKEPLSEAMRFSPTIRGISSPFLLCQARKLRLFTRLAPRDSANPSSARENTKHKIHGTACDLRPLRSGLHGAAPSRRPLLFLQGRDVSPSVGMDIQDLPSLRRQPLLVRAM